MRDNSMKDAGLRTQLERMIINDFCGFLSYGFAILNPNRAYQHNWHIELISEYLKAIEQGQITRLIINLPPRSLKSTMISVAWPAWLLAHNPSMQIMAASYSQQLADKHSQDCRMIVQSEAYQRCFSDTKLCRTQNEKHKWMTSKRGMRLATSIWGSATGEGGDILIADDVMNALQAQSAMARASINDWFDHTFATRLNDKKKGAIIVVMQRLHEDDTTGHLLQKGGWEHLCLPAMAEQTLRYQMNGKTWTRKRGSLLHAKRENTKLIERAKTELGSAHFNAQYQQNPLPQGGGMIELDWFVRF
ncbi:MAG: hypothetical protein MRY32_04480 [Rickettsiales bacterium]|nr:hypothetical protein [Rickettsiales bacterium]